MDGNRVERQRGDGGEWKGGYEGENDGGGGSGVREAEGVWGVWGVWGGTQTNEVCFALLHLMSGNESIHLQQWRWTSEKVMEEMRGA